MHHSFVCGSHAHAGLCNRMVGADNPGGEQLEATLGRDVLQAASPRSPGPGPQQGKPLANHCHTIPKLQAIDLQPAERALSQSLMAKLGQAAGQEIDSCALCR